MSKETFLPEIIIEDTQDNIEGLKEKAYGWDIDIREMDKKPFHADILATHTPRIQLSEMHYHTPIMIDGLYPEGTIVLSFVWTEGKVHEKNRTYPNDTLIVLSDNKPFDLIVNKPHKIFTLAVEEVLFNRVFQEHFKQMFSTVQSTQDIFFASAEEIEKYTVKFRNCMQIMKEKSGKETSDALYTAIEEEILHSLFSFYTLREKEISYLPKYIRDTRKLLLENITATYAISDLVEELQISPRTLQHGCKSYLGFTPKEYQQYIRFNEIHKTLLQSSDLKMNIADIAKKFNFYHMGHFASEYKKFFGETPSQTLHRAA